MSASKTPPSDIDKLIGDLIDGLLDQAGMARLEAILEADPQVRQRYYHLISVHASLYWRFGNGLQNASEAAPTPSLLNPGFLFEVVEEQGRIAKEKQQTKADWIAQLTNRSEHDPKGQAESVDKDAITARMLFSLTGYLLRQSLTTKLAYKAYGFAAAILVVVLTIVFLLTGPEDQEPIVERPPSGNASPVAQPIVATLIRTHRAQWSGDAPLANGSLGARPMELTGGFAELELADGARVIMQAPASFELIDGNRMALQFGRLVADVPTRAHGFTVQTPGGKVVDLGTRFGVEVDANQRTTAAVFQGEVELHGRTDQAPLALTRNQLAVVESDGRLAAKPQPIDERVARSFAQEWGQVEGLVTRQRYARLDALMQDPSLWLALDFEGDAQAGAIRNLAPSATAPRVTDNGVERVPGREQRLTAMRFDGDGRWVQVHSPGGEPVSAQAVTIAGWFYVGHSDNAHAPLIYADSSATGGIFWHVLADSRLEISITQEPVHGYADFATIDPILDTQQPRWMHLAVVYDQANKRVAFYINGKHKPASQMRRSHVRFGDGFQQGVVLGGMTIGYAQAAPHLNPTNKPRVFKGDVDELMVWRRPLDDKEIALLAGFSPTTDLLNQEPSE